MSIKNFACFKIGATLWVHNALNAVPVDDGFVGWLAQFSFRKPRLKRKLIISCEAWTTYCKMTKTGWQRIRKNHPLATTSITYVAYPPRENRVEPNAFCNGSRSDTIHWTLWRPGRDRWGYQKAEKSESFNRHRYYGISGATEAERAAPSFDVDEMIRHVNNADADLASGYSLFDHLADTDEFGSLISGPQWLPRDWTEFAAAIKAEQDRQDEEARKNLNAVLTDEPEEEDRWR